MLYKVLVYVKRKVFDYYLTAATLCFTCVVLHSADGQCAAYVYGVGTLSTVHALADDNDVGGNTCATKGIFVHTECAHNISIALVDNPVA